MTPKPLHTKEQEHIAQMKRDEARREFTAKRNAIIKALLEEHKGYTQSPEYAAYRAASADLDMTTTVGQRAKSRLYNEHLQQYKQRLVEESV